MYNTKRIKKIKKLKNGAFEIYFSGVKHSYETQSTPIVKALKEGDIVRYKGGCKEKIFILP